VLTKLGAGTLVLSNSNIYSGATIIAGGILSVASSSALGNGGAGNNLTLNGGTLKTSGAFSSNRNITSSGIGGAIDSAGFDSSWGQLQSGNLTKNGAGKVSLAALNGGAITVNAGTLAVKDRAATGANHPAYLSALNIALGAALDLNDNDLVVNGGSFSMIRDWVYSGFRTLPDPAAKGIISTLSQNAGGAQILALFDNALVGVGAWPPVGGQTVSGNAVIGKFTYFGDLNLDGQVTGDDYPTIDSNLNTTPAAGLAWLSGDANLGGIVTGDDYAVIDSNLGNGTTTPLTPLGAVPEPAGLTIVGVFATAGFRRRRIGKELAAPRSFVE